MLEIHGREVCNFLKVEGEEKGEGGGEEEQEDEEEGFHDLDEQHVDTSSRNMLSCLTDE